jgi:type II secretory pathway pseudopilin PulG
MVIVAIVVILSTIVMVGIQEGRKKARDTQRLSDLQQIQLALRMYKDENGKYPSNGCGNASTTWTGATFTSVTPPSTPCTQYIAGLGDFLNPLPKDPNAVGNRGYIYRTNNAGTAYKIMAHQSVEKGIINQGEQYARCPASCTQTYCDNAATYAFYSSSTAECW